jgi:inner membrane protein
MDTLTHALSGALLARATASKDSVDAIPLRRRVLLGAFAAAFPDTDVVTSLLSPLSHLLNHRGITHSLFILPLWALLLGWLCARLWHGGRCGREGLERQKGHGWQAYSGVIALGIAAHIAGDVITTYGTMIFAPFSALRYEISTTFIIDLWFTGIIVSGLVAAWIWRASRVPAVAGLMVLVAYVGFQFALKQQAIEFGERYAREAGIAHAKVTVLPRPVSPFNWMVVIAAEDTYHYSLISLSRSEPPAPLSADAGFFARLAAPYVPLDHAQWVSAARYGAVREHTAIVKEALMRPEFDFFRWFAAYPLLYRFDAGNPVRCVWFQDLRFFTPGRSRWPFRYGMCRSEAGHWKAFELMGDTARRAVQ